MLRTGLIAFMEGAMIYGVFHGDLHGGNLFVLPDGRTALLDFGITGRLDEPQRLAFLRLLMGATTNDVTGQLAALRDLGAFPPDTDLDAVIRDLGLDRPGRPDAAVGRRAGARAPGIGRRSCSATAPALPKELMLFVKNMMFLDGAIAAPRARPRHPRRDRDDLRVLRHPPRRAPRRRHRHRPEDVAIDLDGVKASFGVDSSTEKLTYRDLQERRELIRKRLRDRSSQ